ncbi:MAG: hypothetical protein RSA92_01270 [Bacteroidaceae bacterium]
MVSQDMTVLNNIVRIGEVQSVDVEKRTARVKFMDKSGLISGPLKVVENQPFITVERWVDGDKWEYKAHYATADRKVGVEGVGYRDELPEEIELEKTIEYMKKLDIPIKPPLCEHTGKLEEKVHKEKITIHPWLPYEGQYVLCIYLPKGESDGFVIGGI